VTTLHCAGNYLVSSGTDRFVRVHELGGTRKLVGKMYVKQRVNSVLGALSESPNMDAIWDELQVVQ
jgi:hypothetical protein